MQQQPVSLHFFGLRIQELAQSEALFELLIKKVDVKADVLWKREKKLLELRGIKWREWTCVILQSWVNC